MTGDRGLDGRNAAGAPFPRRSRKPWAIAGGVVGGWLLLYLVAGSAVAATLLLVAFAAATAVAVLFLRSMGVTRGHPWIRRLESRPWRDGQAVLRAAVNHLCDVFVITPSGALFAPTSVEIQLNPGDLASLCDRMEYGVLVASVTEVYEDQVARCGARYPTPERPEVYVVADPRIPRGRYRFLHGNQATAADGAAPVPDGDGWEWREPEPALTSLDARTVVDAGPVTVREKAMPRVPVLRLITGDMVAQTQMTGARAGRGSVEMVLPNVSTISRKHARFSYADGHWFVTNLGMNGLTVNGSPAADQHPLSDGDTIRWGSRPDAVVSRVEIG